MSAARRHRRLTAWIALLAMLAFALLPTVSRAMAYAGGAGNWTELCTPQGVKLVAVDRDDGNPGPASLQLDACGYCTLGTEGAAPLGAAPLALPALPLRSAEPPRLFLQAAHTLFAWRSAPARAPPAIA